MSIIRVTLTGVLVASAAACTGYIQADPGNVVPPPAPPPEMAASRSLDILPRQQMDPNGGYSAETAIQTLALYRGAYLSQDKIRTLATAPVTLDGNASMVLDTLHVAHDAWDSTGPQPQGVNFLAWTKLQIEQGVPVIYGQYASDAATPQPTYDNAVPAIAIAATRPTVFDGNDMLTSSDNDGSKVPRQTGTYAQDRTSCMKTADQGGCLPLGVDFGIAIEGIADAQGATLPVNVKVDVDPEPNEAGGDPAVPVDATVIATGLTPGKSYTLLRYEDPTKLPTNASAAQMLADATAYTHRYDFIATDVLYTLTDPNPFQSDGTVYYRCIPR